ncbi:putative allantoate permease [Ascoidea rubescens DSM 1968]|uniref:Putative allantoate permease n=1 Tax=Ascoidea rubescens DSM 1968 TaxID=1344418 RepID=A0A1D2VPI5_9ASCO|nr:putative allantoate permease [Ascoidea rubescens DSM 1968]ODV63520.1 putative allantoate permease [Ascoidea rubescens DSM 1968]
MAGENRDKKDFDVVVNSPASSLAEIDLSDLDDDLKKNPFLDPKIADYYRLLYEQRRYECRAHFDPYYVWDEDEEKKLIRKLDYKVTFLACLMFAALQLDRYNLKTVTADNFLDDLNMDTDDYNTGNIIFTTCFLSAELPSQLISKKIGPDRWIPIEIISWSIVALFQCFLSGKKSFFATRAILGLLLGGFIPDTILWLSYFYKSAELTIRLSYFWVTYSITNIVAGFLAYGILRMRGIGGMAGWRWCFLLEGLLTLLIGIYAAFAMVPSAVQTKTLITPNGWFTEREEKIVVNRVLRDDPSKGEMNNRQGITLKMLLKSFFDYDLWPIYILGFIAYIPVNTLSSYLSLVCRSLGFSTFNTTLMTIPYNVLHIITLLIITKISEVLNERTYVCLVQPIYTVPLVAVLAFWGGAMIEKWPTWIIATVTLGNPYIHAILVSWCSRNSNSVRLRTVSASLYNMFVQAGSIVASKLYVEKDKPLYRVGNRKLFGFAVAMFPMLLLIKLYYLYKNNQREKVWNSFNEEEKLEYLEKNRDKGNKMINFRFVH